MGVVSMGVVFGAVVCSKGRRGERRGNGLQTVVSIGMRVLLSRACLTTTRIDVEVGGRRLV